MKLRDLHTLEVISQLGSMAKASRELGLSQPAISKAIGEMEYVLGVQLLERSAIGVELTPSGAALVERTRAVFDEVRLGVSDIKRLADPYSGEVRVGATEPLAVTLAEIINRMSSKYPRITYGVTISDTTTLMRALRDRDLDIVVTRWTAQNAADDLLALPLYNGPLGVMVHKVHPLLKHKRLELRDLMNERWTLSPPGSFLGHLVGAEFRRHKLQYPHATVTSVSIYMRLTLLASSNYLTMLPMSILRHPTDRKWLRALAVKLRPTPGCVAAITLKRRKAAGPIALFQTISKEITSTY